jgi:DNA-binding transcriptional ArsR family regulator
MVTYNSDVPQPEDAGLDRSVDVVFKALADPTRRALLDALFVADGQSATALCARFPGMTRFGVMKHLGVLVAANLVVVQPVRRQRLHYLNPVPIGQIADRWISKYAQPFTHALVELQAQLDHPNQRRGAS